MKKQDKTDSMTTKIVDYLSDPKIEIKAVLLGPACDVEALREEVVQLREKLAVYEAIDGRTA